MGSSSCFQRLHFPCQDTENLFSSVCVGRFLNCYVRRRRHPPCNWRSDDKGFCSCRSQSQNCRTSHSSASWCKASSLQVTWLCPQSHILPQSQIFTSISYIYLNFRFFTSISGFVFTGSVSFFVPMEFSSQYEEHFGKLFAKLFLTLSSARTWNILVLISFWPG